MSDRPVAPACERNKAPILAVLEDEFAGARRVLEIGSGTGQHAAWFAPRLPHLAWVATDLPERLPGIRTWLTDLEPSTRPEVMALDVTGSWPDVGLVDAAFSANTAHVIAREDIPAMFAGLSRCLRAGAPFCLYGPFAVDGRHTGEGNAAFDARLRAKDPSTGIRDLGWMRDVAEQAGFVLERIHVMPSDNRLVVWRKN